MTNSTHTANTPVEMPLLPLRGLVLFPISVVPLFIGRESSLAAVAAAETNRGLLFTALQKDTTVELPTVDSIYPIGTVVQICGKNLEPNGSTRVVVSVSARARLVKVLQESPFFRAHVAVLPTDTVVLSDIDRQQLEKTLKLLAPQNTALHQALASGLPALNSLGDVADWVASECFESLAVRQNILELLDSRVRWTKVLDLLKCAPQ